MTLKQTIPSLPQGFKYIANFISQDEKQRILNIVMNNQWCGRLRREQQYYGIKYFHTKYLDNVLQNKESNDYFPLELFDFIRNRIKKELSIKSFSQNFSSPNQVLVNKYLKSDHLGVHIEDTMAFGDCILGLSLGSEDYLRLVPANQYGDNKEGEIKVKLEDRSVYILEGDSRYQWKHGIGRVFEGKQFKEKDFIRISLTFRDVIESRRKL